MISHHFLSSYLSLKKKKKKLETNNTTYWYFLQLVLQFSYHLECTARHSSPNVLTLKNCHSITEGI